MANKLFTAFCEIVLRKRGVDEGIDETKRKAKDMGKSFEREGARSEKALSRMGETASKVQAAVGKILIPAAVVSALAAVVEGLQRAAGEAERFRKQLDESLSTARNLATDVSRIGISEGLREQLSIEDQIRAQRETINKQLDQQLEKLNTFRGRLSDSLGLIANGQLASVSAARDAADALQELDQLSRRLQEARERREADAARRKEQQERQANQERLNRLREQNDLAELEASGDPELEALAEYRRRFTQINEQIRNEKDADIRRELERQRDIERQKYQERLKGIREARQAEEDADRERRQAEKDHQDELDRRQQERHQARLRQIEREAQAATRGAEQAALRLGVAAGNADRLLSEINSKTRQPTMRIRTMRGGG